MSYKFFQDSNFSGAGLLVRHYVSSQGIALYVLRTAANSEMGGQAALGINEIKELRDYLSECIPIIEAQIEKDESAYAKLITPATMDKKED